jgi:hypothetical protein
MKGRSGLRLAVAGVAALGPLAAVVSAQSTLECDRTYKSFMEKMTPAERARIPAERLVALNRRAQRIYDACRTGHLDNPKTLFENLDRAMR